MVESYIAKRDLLFTFKLQAHRRRFAVGLSAPYLLQEGMVPFKFDSGAAGCKIIFDGLPEDSIEIFGADTLQAIQLASNIEPYLKGLSRKYDFYWPSGEPYFNDSSAD